MWRCCWARELTVTRATRPPGAARLCYWLQNTDTLSASNSECILGEGGVANDGSCDQHLCVSTVRACSSDERLASSVHCTSKLYQVQVFRVVTFLGSCRVRGWLDCSTRKKPVYPAWDTTLRAPTVRTPGCFELYARTAMCRGDHSFSNPASTCRIGKMRRNCSISSYLKAYYDLHCSVHYVYGDAENRAEGPGGVLPCFACSCALAHHSLLHSAMAA